MDANPTHYGATNNNVNGKPVLEDNLGPAVNGAHSEDVQLTVPVADTRLSGTANEGSDEEEDIEEQQQRKDENSLDTLCVVGFCLGLVGFLSTFHLKLHLFRRRAPYPLVGNIQDIDPSMVPMQVWEDGVNLVPVIWGLRYIRKIGLTLFHHRCLSQQGLGPAPEVRVATSGCCSGDARASWWRWYVVPVVLYHGGLAVWVGLATNYHLPYHVSDIEWVVGGLAVFLAGELTAVVRTLLARRAIHKGRLEDSSSWWRCCGCCPGVRRGSVMSNSKIVEVGEVLSCVGFALFTLTLPACLMALVRLVIAIPVCVRKLHGKPF